MVVSVKARPPARERTRFCTKSTAVGTAACKPARPLQQNFLPACRSEGRSCGSPSPAEYPLDDVALPVFGAVEQPWQPGLGLAFHGSQRNNRLPPVKVAVLAQVLGIVALVC